MQKSDGVNGGHDTASHCSLHNDLKALKISSDATSNNCEAWRRWWQQFELYLLATGLDKSGEKRKIAILLHHIGEKCLNIFNTFNINIGESTLHDVKAKFDEFFQPRKNITMYRHMFFTTRQQKSESIEDFLTDLENKSQDCEFGTLRESLIRDIFIANLSLDLAHVRQRLLQEPDLTYQRMRELARTLIVAQQDADQIVKRSTSEESEKVMHLRRRSRGRVERQRRRASPVSQQGSSAGRSKSSPSPEKRSRTCSRCGQHHRYKCPAQGAKCRSCNSYGHFAKFCYSNNKKVSHLESFSSTGSQDNFVGILNCHNFSHSHKSSQYNCHLESQSHHNQNHYRHSRLSYTQSDHKLQSTVRSHIGQSQSMSKRSHEDSSCHKKYPVSYFCDESGDNAISERSNKKCLSDEKRLVTDRSERSNEDSCHMSYLNDENTKQSERFTVKSKKSKSLSRDSYLNDEYRHKSEESHTTNTCRIITAKSTHSKQVNTVESKENKYYSKQSWNINILVGHTQINCIIDSGADINIMSKKTFQSLKCQSQMSLEKCQINVSGFGGISIPIMGKVNIKCSLSLNNSTISVNIVFIVADLVCPNVLGLPTCEKLGIIQRVFSVSQQNFSEQILTQYNDVFQGLGCLPQVCRLKLKPEAVPCVDAPRRVPFALLNKLRDELDRMEKMQVLVPSSVFISREESRRDVPVVRVRSFGTSALSTPARDLRWDRLRVVCAQPHNKHCQFGLSFVHVDEAAPVVAPRVLALDTLSSDEDDFKPGELFAKHLQSTSGELQTTTNMNTGQQIRQATSQALKNIPESSTKLLKTPFSKPTATRALSPPSVSVHTRRDKEHDQSSKTTKHDDTDKHNNINKKTKGDSNVKEESKIKNETKTKAEPKRTPRGNEHESPSSDQNKEVRKRKRSSQESIPGPAPPRLLEGCVLVLSGYLHPRRAAVRDLALAMGARVRPDWGPGATHLICAFPNTPKLRAVRAADPHVPVVRAEWLQHVAERRRLLPWRWFATEPHHRLPPDEPPTDEQAPDTRHTQHDSDGDTDDEIEKVLQAQKKRRLTESKTKNEANKRDDSPVTTTSDVTRAASTDTDDAVSTDEEGADRGSPGPAAPGPAALPDFFSGLTFLLCASPGSVLHMSRYVRAYGGLVLEMSEVAEGSDVDYIVRGRGADLRHVPVTCSPRAGHVSAAWLARCHDAKARLPHEHTLTEIS